MIVRTPYGNFFLPGNTLATRRLAARLRAALGGYILEVTHAP